MREEIIKLFKEFLEWRTKENNSRRSWCEEQNRNVENKKGITSGFSYFEVGDGINDFMDWLKVTTPSTK